MEILFKMIEKNYSKNDKVIFDLIMDNKNEILNLSRKEVADRCFHLLHH